MLAAKCNNVTAAKRLIVTSNINEANAAGSTALHFAAFYGSAAVAEILLDKEADVNLQTKTGMSALIYAAMKGHTDMVKVLVENKADLNLQTNIGWSALMEAARYGHTDMVKVLVENKADLNLQTNIGWSALMEAARYGHTDMVKVLVENKADVNMPEASGATALKVAVEQGHLKMAEVLVEHGADVNAQDLAGRTPLMRAAQKGNKEMVDWLIDKAKASVFPISRAGATAQQMASAYDSDDEELQKELKRTSEKTLASQFQTPSVPQKLHYMIFDTFCLPYLLVGICVGGIVPWSSPWSTGNGVRRGTKGTGTNAFSLTLRFEVANMSLGRQHVKWPDLRTFLGHVAVFEVRYMLSDMCFFAEHLFIHCHPFPNAVPLTEDDHVLIQV